MVISALNKKGNNVLVCFDGGEFLTLDYRTVVDNKLRINDELDESLFEKLNFESSLHKAKDSAFRLLGRRHHSVSELRIKLIKKKYSVDVIRVAIQELLEKQYLDDSQFADEYTQDRVSKRKIGVIKLKAELFKKGIDKKIIENVISNVSKAESDENIRFIASKKLKLIQQRTTDKNKVKAKLYSYLSGRGFESEQILKTLNELGINSEY